MAQNDIGYIARNLQQLLKLFVLHQEFPHSLENIKELASELADKPIEYLELQMTAEDSLIKGCCVISKDKYSILVLAGQNECWNRFVTCKEIMHVLIDCDEYRNLNIDDHLEKYFYTPPDIPLSTISEFIAESEAMELLFPYKERTNVLNSGIEDFFEVAKKYMIPKAYVLKYLSDPYMDYFKKVEDRSK